jgi:hypothetical protein
MSDQDNHNRSVAAASAILDDGTIVEMLHRPDIDETTFAVSMGGHHDERDSVGSLRPFAPANNLITHGVVLFPSAVGEAGPLDTLLADVRAFIHRYADVSEPFEELASLYVLLTWVYDAFTEVPYLRLKGDFGSGKSRCLQTIGSICYKPMFVSGASTVSPIFRIIDSYRGTLVLDESDFRLSDEKAEIVKILNNGNASGFPVLRSEPTPTKDFNPRAFVVFGPKVIATRKDFTDQALESRCITEVMNGLPPRDDIPLTLPGEFNVEAETLRNRLLRYRFDNFATIRRPDLKRESGVEARVAQVFAPLIAIAPTEAIRERVRAVARAGSTTIQAARLASIEAQLLGIMFGMRRDGVPLAIRDIADRFASEFGEDYTRPVTARWMGGQLRKRLSLTSVKVHGTFVVPETEHPRLTALFERYDLREEGVACDGLV